MESGERLRRHHGSRTCAVDHILTALDALGDLDLPLASQQRDGTHFTEVHAHRVVGLFALLRRRPSIVLAGSGRLCLVGCRLLALGPPTNPFRGRPTPIRFQAPSLILPPIELPPLGVIELSIIDGDERALPDVTVRGQGCNTPRSRRVPSSLELPALETHEGSWCGENPTVYKFVPRGVHISKQLQPWITV